MSREVLLPVAILALLLTATGCGGGASRRGAGGETGTNSQSRNAAPGGEKSIEDFGAEAMGSRRAALLSAFHALLGAIAAHRYPIACSSLSATLHRSLSRLLARGSKQRRCPAILAHLLSPSAAPIARQQARGEITRVRVAEGRAFVVFHAPGASLYELPMVLGRGGWKASLLTPSILVPSAATLGH